MTKQSSFKNELNERVQYGNINFDEIWTAADQKREK